MFSFFPLKELFYNVTNIFSYFKVSGLKNVNVCSNNVNSPKEFLVLAGIVTVTTKQGISREAAILYPFEETRKALYEGAKKAVSIIPRCKPFTLELPVKCKLEYIDSTSEGPKK